MYNIVSNVTLVDFDSDLECLRLWIGVWEITLLVKRFLDDGFLRSIFGDN